MAAHDVLLSLQVQVHDVSLVVLVGHGCMTCNMVAWKCWINMLAWTGNAMLDLTEMYCSVFRPIFITLEHGWISLG